MTKDRISTSINTELIYQAEGSLLIVRFYGFQRSEQAAKDNQAIVETVRQKRVRLLLINQRDIKVLSREMQSLIVDNAAKMVNSGVKKVAVVLPEDVFALASVSKIHSESKLTGIAIQSFSSEGDAIEWLRNQHSII